jgi:hypothetical protein
MVACVSNSDLRALGILFISSKCVAPFAWTQDKICLARYLGWFHEDRTSSSSG